MEKTKKLPYRYCIVPMCKNTTNTAPDKVFFNVPRGADVRKEWCKIMRREMVSPSTCLYCCEDHFNVEEDTGNYMQYRIMALQEKRKTILRLKEGIFPHKFECQKNIQSLPPLERKRLLKRKGFLNRNCIEISEEALSSAAKQGVGALNTESLQNDNTEVCTDISSSHIYIQIEDTATNNSVVGGCSVSSSNVYSKDMHVDDTVQLESEVQENNGVHVNLWIKIEKQDVSPPITSDTACIPPLKIDSIKRELLIDEPTDISSTSPAQSSILTTSFKPESSSELSPTVPGQSTELEEIQIKNQMRNCMLIAIEKEPKMLVGLPKKSLYLIKMLSEDIPLPTINILITLKKIKLNESFSILALQFGYTQSEISTIFSKSLPLLADKMKQFIVWPTQIEIFKKLPILFRDGYPNIVSIIDCLEIKIEKPDAVNQSLTWTQFNKCDILKYLISFTPDGLVNFVSSGYRGRTTDVAIVEGCGYVECLPPKTAVMSDRDFKDVSHLLGKKGCILVRPPVCKFRPNTKKGLQSNKIATLRIHIRNVLNRLREFQMLLPNAYIDHDLIPVMDNIMIVACGLVNMQHELINK